MLLHQRTKSFGQIPVQNQYLKQKKNFQGQCSTAFIPSKDIPVQCEICSELT